MKRFIVLLTLSALLFAFPAAAQEAAQPLAQDEITSFNRQVLERAIQDELEALPEESYFVARGPGYEVLLKTAQLNLDALVLGAAVTGLDEDTELFALPRGAALGMRAEEVLSLFQNDNAFLAGTRESAALYISGELPAMVMTGFVLRDGQRLMLLEYDVYTQADGGVTRAGMQYTLEDGALSAVRSFVSPETLSQEEARGEISKLQALQEESGYIAYGTKENGPLTREDMVIAGLDFFDLTQEGAVLAFGEAANREEANNSDDSQFITLQWPEAEAVFQKAGEDERALRVTLSGGMAEGPRGLRLGDTLAQAISRFDHGEELPQDGGALYGDAANQVPPYGAMVQGADRVLLYYVISSGDEDAALILTFMDDRLIDMTLAYL